MALKPIHQIENFSNRCVWFFFYCAKQWWYTHQPSLTICLYSFKVCSGKTHFLPVLHCVFVMYSISLPALYRLNASLVWSSTLKSTYHVLNCILPLLGTLDYKVSQGPFFFLILWTSKVKRDFIMSNWLSAIHISGWIGEFDISRLPAEWDRHFCNHAELEQVGAARQ